MIITLLFNLWYMPDIVFHVSIFEFILLIIDLLSIYIVVRYIRLGSSSIVTTRNHIQYCIIRLNYDLEKVFPKKYF